MSHTQDEHMEEIMLSGMFGMYRDYRARVRDRQKLVATYAAVSQLPAHIQKDIGWPNAYDRQRGF